MRTAFVTSSGTGVGKTLVMEALVSQLRRAGRRVRAVKPVVSGFEAERPEGSDPARILAALGEDPTPATVDRVSPWRFAAPLSPDVAAAREGRAIDFDRLVEFCRAGRDGAEDDLLIEGIGGVMVPLTDRHTVLDWIAALGTPAVLVAGSYLGALSHALTAAAVLERRGVEIAGLVVSESPESALPGGETAEVLGRHLPGVAVSVLPRLGPGPPWAGVPDLTGLLGPPR
jgi:dethiobiotin synthetase